MSAEQDRLTALRNDARYARERAQLYRAKTRGGRPTSPERMRELDRASEAADARLAAALDQARRG